MGIKRASIAKTASASAVLLMTIVGFQNCGKVRLTENLTVEQSQDRKTDVSFKDMIIPVDVNKPKTINIVESSSFKGTISLADSEMKYAQTFALEGDVTLDGTILGQITYNPSFGYRGELSLPIYIKYADGKIEIVKLTFQVQNPLRNFKPALIVRAGECMLCHANIKGDVISDYGYKSNIDNGPDLFFRQNFDDPNYSLAYSASHSPASPGDTGWGTAKIDGKLVIPKVDLNTLPTNVTRKFSISRDYIENAVTKTAATLLEFVDKIMFVDKTRVKSIVEKKTVYIGAFTEDDIRTAGRLSANVPIKFVKESADNDDFSGFEHDTTDGKDYYTNTDTMVCNGDLFVDGVVWLNNLNLKTEKGCRIHATKTVFVNGPITYIDEYALSNLQITSAKAIYMGMGMCYDCYTAPVDNPDAYYNMNFAGTRAGQPAFWAGEFRTRNHAAMAGYSASIVADFRKISNEGNIPRPAPGTDLVAYYSAQIAAQKIKMFDANNAFNNTSNTSYRRLLLNAPDVQSRYNGKFEGTIIAEFAMWRLGQFVFQFDSVFTAVPIFPLMNISSVISLED